MKEEIGNIEKESLIGEMERRTIQKEREEG